MPSISKYASGTLDFFAKLYRTISGIVGNHRHAILERSTDFAVTVAFLSVPAYAFAWYFNLSDSLASSIAITVLVTLWPVLKLISLSEPFAFWPLDVSIALLFWLTLAMVLGLRQDWPLLSSNTFFILLALPSCLVVWESVRREWILVAGFAPALVAMMVYWFAGLTGNDEGYDLLLAPIPVIFFGGAIWAPVALLALKFARRHKNGRISGPATQVLAMAMLFYPVTLVAIIFPPDLGLSPTWSNVSLALIGLFLSGAISDPLRRMLIEWGNLAPHKD